jgi:hypothetical protein
LRTRFNARFTGRAVSAGRSGLPSDTVKLTLFFHTARLGHSNATSGVVLRRLVRMPAPIEYQSYHRQLGVQHAPANVVNGTNQVTVSLAAGTCFSG